jgi:lipopolysaccharide export system permease protein
MATLEGVRATPLAPPGPTLRLTIMDAYILRELAAPFAFSAGVYMLFWFINIFFVAADYLINAHANIFLILRFLAFRVPQSIPMAFPFGCLFATLVAFGRMAADNEITAMRTSGISFLRIAAAPLIAGVGMFIFTYIVNDSIVPRSIELSTRTFYQIIYKTETLPVVPRFFRKDDATDRVFYVGNVGEDHKTLQNVMIFENATNTPYRRVMNAEHAHIEKNSLILDHARVTIFKRTGELDSSFVQDAPVQLPLPFAETADQFLNTSSADQNALDSSQLRAQIRSMEATGQGGNALDLLKITLAQKLSFPFASFVAVLIALPLAVAFGHRGRTLGIALSFVLMFAYYLMLSAAAALGRNEAINPYLAAWIPNIILGIIGAAMIRRVGS